MFSFWKYRKYFVLSCLTTVIIFTPTLVEAIVTSPAQQSIQVAPRKTDNNVADEVQIKKAIFLNEQKNHWHPQIGTITVVDNYAIATVHDDVTGGESVLKKEQGAWKVVGGGGGAITRPEQLINYFKVPPDTAHRLLQVRAGQQR